MKWIAALLIMLCSVPAQGHEFSIPLTTTAKGWVLVEVKISGRTVTALFDTGAQTSIVSPDLAKLGHDRGQRQTIGVNGNTMADTVTVRIDLGGTMIQERNVLTTRLDNFTHSAGKRIDAVIGMDVLRDYSRITIDLKARKVSLEE